MGHFCGAQHGDEPDSGHHQRHEDSCTDTKTGHAEGYNERENDRPSEWSDGDKPTQRRHDLGSSFKTILRLLGLLGLCYLWVFYVGSSR